MSTRHVTAIRIRDDQRLAVELDGKAWVVLDPLTAARLGLSVDVAVDSNTAAAAEAEASRERALLRGARLTARRSHARGELEQRIARGDGETAAQEAVERLVELGVVDDERHATELAQHRLGAGWGPARIEHDLLAAGVEEALVQRTLSEIPTDDLLAAAAAALGPRTGAAGWQRLIARGFDETTAEQLLGATDQI